MSSSRLESLHAQLGTLLENAQFLLADSAAPSSNYYGTHALSASGPKTLVAPPAVYSLVAMQAEIRTLEFWRSIIAECVATFFYVTIVLSVSTSSSSPSSTVGGVPTVDANFQTNSALSAGLAMAMLTACFAKVSGCHANPAVTVGTTLAKHISPLRCILYVAAQCGGAIAGAALVLGVHGTIRDPALTTGGGTFGMEFVLTFLVVYAFCASREPVSPSPPRPQLLLQQHRQLQSSTNTPLLPAPAAPPGSVRADAVVVGVAYAACLVCWKGSLNPARALGSAFVSRATGRFQQHWVFWVGPILGAVTGAFAYEYIFNTRRRTGFAFGSRTGTGGMPEHPLGLEHISVRSEDDMLDDLERAKQYKANIVQDFNDQSYSTRASAAAAAAAYNKRTGLGPQEPVYGGTKSMFNQPIYDRYNDGSKSCYSGYDGGDGRSAAAAAAAANLRRSRSIHTKFPGGNFGMNVPGGMTRRNPYDYLPDEPISKPDIMQSSMGGGVKSSVSPRYMDDAYDTGVGVRGPSDNLYGRSAKDDYDYGKRPGYSGSASGVGQAGSSSAAGVVTGVASSDVGGHFGVGQASSSVAASGAAAASSQGVNRGDFQRMSRMRNEFYSPQYNASYSQQNGCSITTNSAVSGSGGGAGVGGGYRPSAANY